MNNSTTLLRALESGDTSDTTLSAAIDALREDHGYSLFVAVREALRSIECGAEARQVAAGCSCIAEGALFRDRLLKECRTLVNVPMEEASTTFVNPGDGAPSGSRTPDRDRASGWGCWQIFVGALWLLRRNDELTGDRHRQIVQAAIPRRRK